MREIKIKFSLTTGECRVEASGFKGRTCMEATSFLEKALGEVTSLERKAEWYESAYDTDRVRVRNGDGEHA